MVEFVRFSEHLIQDGFTYSYGVSAADFTGTGSLDLVVGDVNTGLNLSRTTATATSLGI